MHVSALEDVSGAVPEMNVFRCRGIRRHGDACLSWIERCNHVDQDEARAAAVAPTIRMARALQAINTCRALGSRYSFATFRCPGAIPRTGVYTGVEENAIF